MMHLRYDPLAETIMSGATSIADVSQADLDFIRRRMRDICKDWDHQRRYVLRMPQEVKPARCLRDWAKAPPPFFDMRRCELELVREPRRAPRPLSIARRWAFNPVMGNMINEKALAMQALRDYCVKDVEMVMAQPPRMPPLDAPKPDTNRPGPKPRWVDGQAFIDALRKRGYKTLGAGSFSTVLAKGNSNRVIKVNRRSDSWLDYVLWSAKRGHMGRHAPMVYSFRRFNEGKPNEFYVAVVERCAYTVDDVYRRMPNIERLFSHLTSGMRGYMGSERDALAADDLAPGSLRFAIEFKLEFGGAATDLHAGNFMVRDNGSIVCTDPLTGDASDSAPSRWRHTSARLAA